MSVPEFVVVISDPRVKSPRIVPVEVIGMEDLEYDEKHKEQKALPTVKMSPKLVEILKPVLNIVVVRIWKNRAAGEKVSLVGKVVEDTNMDLMSVGVPQGFLSEKIGSGRAIGEVMPAPAFQVRVPETIGSRLVGLKIGDRIDGKMLGLPNITLEVRGGSDLAGFPMRPDIEGAVKKYVLLSSKPGFRPKKRGERRRKLVRGNTVSPEIVQINTVIVA